MPGQQLALAQLLAPSGQFNFTHTDEWQRWMKRLEHYRIASGLDKQSQVFQVNAFMYASSDDAEDILNVLPLTDVQKQSYQAVTEALTAHCVSKRNDIHERALQQAEPRAGWECGIFQNGSAHTGRTL